MPPTKIRKLYLPKYQQFRRCIVDFTTAPFSTNTRTASLVK